MEKMYMNFYTQKYIYKITNKINGLAYIGQANDYERRFTEHRKYKVNQEVDTKLLYQAFEKYGIENFNFEVIGLYANYNEMERYWVAYYDTYYNGYNMTPGGDEPPVLNGEKKIINPFGYGTGEISPVPIMPFPSRHSSYSCHELL